MVNKITTFALSLVLLAGMLFSATGQTKRSQFRKRGKLLY